MLGCIRLENDTEADALFFNQQRLQFLVSIMLTCGRTVQRDIEFPRDQPRFGQVELEAKFRSLVSQGEALARRMGLSHRAKRLRVEWALKSANNWRLVLAESSITIDLGDCAPLKWAQLNEERFWCVDMQLARNDWSIVERAGLMH